MIILMPCIPVLAANHTLTPYDGAVMYELPECFTVTGAYGSKVVYYLDGAKIGMGDEFGDFAVPDMSYGKHTLKAVLILSNGGSESVTSEFIYAKRSVVKSVEETFDVLYSKEDSKISADSTKNEVSRVGFSLANEQNTDVYYSQGRSGEEGDGALKMEVNTDDRLVAYNAYIQSSNFTAFTTGITEVEFDIKLASDKADQIRFTDMYLWAGAGIDLLLDGKWAGTGIVAGTEWTNIKIVSDADNKKVSLAIDGKTVYDGDYTMSSSYKNETIRFTLVQPVARIPGEARAAFSLDNFRAENSKLYKGIEGVTGFINGEETSMGEMISASSESICVHFNEPIDRTSVSVDNVTMKTSYGLSVPLSKVSCSSNGTELTLVPASPLKGGESYVVSVGADTVFADGITFGKPYEARFKTKNELVSNEVTLETDNKELYITDQIKSGKNVTAYVGYENISGTECGATYILTARKDGKLVAIASKTMTFAVDEADSFEFGFNSGTDLSGCEIQFMVCDSFSNLQAIGEFIDVN